MKQRRSRIISSTFVMVLMLATVLPVHTVAMAPGEEPGQTPVADEALAPNTEDKLETEAEESLGPEAASEGPLDPEATPEGSPDPEAVPEGAVGPEAAPNAAPSIDFWYGTYQYFGHKGVPQTWINLVGNVWDADGIASLTYEINNRGERQLNWGPDNYRLEDQGDFNADPPFSDFRDGENEVVFRAKDKKNNTTTRTLTVNYDADNVWELPYYIDWSDVSDIQQVAQIVDGAWEIQDDQLHNAQQGYDRLVTLGDTTWTDYEVTVPVTIHSMWDYGRPGVGIIVRWNGHGNDNDQPHYEHPFGGLGWYQVYYEGPQLELRGNGNTVIDHKNYALVMGDTYIFKMRVETSWKNDYYLKVWPAGDPEPSGWDLHSKGTWINPDVESHGSVVLVSHRSDASFGNVTVTPLQDGYTLTTETVAGQGTVTDTPGEPYSYGQTATLTPQPAVGYLFSGWGGEDADDLVDNGNGTWSLSMVKNRYLTASFMSSDCWLTLDTVGQGSVGRDPDKDPYDCGEQVTLTPDPALGWSFDAWTGPDQEDPGDNGDGTWSLDMNADKTITAIFTEDEYALTIYSSPEEHGTVVSEPDQETYFYGQVVTLTAVPEPGWSLTQWTGPSAGDVVAIGDGTWSLTMTGDKELTANFTEDLYDVTVTVMGGGTVSNTPGNPYLYLELATLRPVPADSALFAGWSGPDAADLMDIGDGTWRLRMTEDKEVTAMFAATRIYVPLIVNNH